MKKLIFTIIIFNMLFFVNADEETGLASWYRPDFHGKKTASGEIFNTYDYTAAHKTLPFGTYVKVVSLENDKEVIVRINDRGPFAESRIIDLSKAAANELGFIDQGVMKVKISIHKPNENEVVTPVIVEDIVGKAIKTTPTDSPTNVNEISNTNPVNTSSKYDGELQKQTEIKESSPVNTSNKYNDFIYDLQLGSFKTYYYALDLIVKIDKLLNVKPIITNVNINGIDMYRVILSDLSKEEVDKYLSILNKNGLEHFIRKKKPT